MQSDFDKKTAVLQKGVKEMYEGVREIQNGTREMETKFMRFSNDEMANYIKDFYYG
jgi:hypothetical protein